MNNVFSTLSQIFNFLVVVFCILVVTTVVLFIIQRIGKTPEIKQKVVSSSAKIISLKQFNNRWSFYSLPKTIKLSTTSHLTDQNAILSQVVRENADQLTAVCKQAEENKRNYSRYLHEIGSSISCTPLSTIKESRIPSWLFHQVEEELYSEYMLSPRASFNMKVRALFPDTEKERRNYVFSYSQLQDALSLYQNELYQYNKKLVGEKSTRLHALRKLNDITKNQSERLESEYVYTKYCSSSTEYRKYEHSDLYLIEIMSESLYTFQNRIRQAEKNAQLVEFYKKAYNEIPPTDPAIVQSIDKSGKFFYEIEEKLFSSMRLSLPPAKFSIRTIILYTSPQGRSSSKWYALYDYGTVEEYFYKEQKRRQNKETYEQFREVERAKMTPSLRYDVLKRDGFRCVICGASAADGVTLHVDHIKPVSKGGKTEMSNLRTLCDRCNMGKRAKYDPYGPN